MKIFIFILLIFPMFIYGQKTKKIVDKKTNEVYYIVKSKEKTDKQLMHGTYIQYGGKNNILIKGYYKNGVKDSVWECFTYNGDLSLKYDYSSNMILFYDSVRYMKNVKFSVKHSDKTSDVTLSRPPVFLGGQGLISHMIFSNIKYPKEARENGISGKVYVCFTIDKSGNPGNFYGKTNIGYGLEEESIRVLKLLPPTWLPGLVGDEPVDVEVEYPVNFILQ